jgi:hypothetical protein
MRRWCGYTTGVGGGVDWGRHHTDEKRVPGESIIEDEAQTMAQELCTLFTLCEIYGVSDQESCK